MHAAKQRFGASSENGQYLLFDEKIIENIVEPNSSVIKIKERKRPVRKKGDRKKLTEGLIRETVECVLNPEEAVCGTCGSELKVIGKKQVRSEMEYIPAKLIMKDYVQYVYKCTDCGKNDENPYV